MSEKVSLFPSLKPLVLNPYIDGEVKPLGWYKRQLRIQADGLSGHLDEMWPDIRDSKWIGGTADSWERVPYWLDGVIPLAYLLDDDILKGKVKRYVDAMLNLQQEDGWMMPCSDEERATYDLWAVLLVSKVLCTYAEFSKDERIDPALRRMLRQFKNHIASIPLFGWATARWYEGLIAIYWLYERKPEQWLMDLANLLRVQGMDYDCYAHTIGYKMHEAKKYWTMVEHVVNLAMALKSEALFSRVSGEDHDDFAQFMLSEIQKEHGTVTGHFNGDECLSGSSPIQGTECCGVVEAMYSYEQLLSLTGRTFFADQLELMAFNELPATLTPDMWAHQYDQMVNQVQCSIIPKDKVHFVSNSADAHLFGLEPCFGCCTSNFNQGFPKMAAASFMYNKEGIYAVTHIPVSLNTTVEGVGVSIRQEAEYPFEDQLKYVIECEKPVNFPFFIRIPSYVKEAYVDGAPAKAGEFFRIKRTFGEKNVISVQFVFDTKFVAAQDGMVAVRRGGLFFSVDIGERKEKMEYVRDGVERKFPYCDYQIYPTKPWNYAYTDDKFTLKRTKVGEYPFEPSASPLRMTAKAVRIPWNMEGGVISEYPESLEPQGKEEEIELIPYGCTNIRITQIPYIKLEESGKGE